MSALATGPGLGLALPAASFFKIVKKVLRPLKIRVFLKKRILHLDPRTKTPKTVISNDFIRKSNQLGQEMAMPGRDLRAAIFLQCHPGSAFQTVGHTTTNGPLP